MNQLSTTVSTRYGRLFEFLNLSIPVLMGIFIIRNPYPRTTAIEEITFYGAVLILLILLILRKTSFSMRTPLSIPFALLVLWSCVGLFFALNKDNSIHDVYAHLIKYLAVFYLLFNFFNTKERLRILIWTIIVSTAIFSVWIMVYFYLILGYSLSTKLGLFMDEIASNTIGISTLFAMLLCLYQFMREEIGYRKIILAICICVTSTATLATQTRGSILAMFVSLLLSFPKNKKTISVLFLFLIMAVFLMPVKNRLSPQAAIDTMSISQRINAWYCFGEMLKDHPIAGIGFGMQTYFDENLLAEYNERVPIKYRQLEPLKAPHNLVVDIAVRLGLVGLAFFFYILFEFFRMGRHVIKNGKKDFFRHWSFCLMVALIAFLIQGLFESTMSGPPAIVFYTIMAMMAILWHLNNKQDIDGKTEVINSQAVSGQRGSSV